MHQSDEARSYATWKVVVCPAGLTVPVTLATVALVECTPEDRAMGAPWVNSVTPSFGLAPEPLVATSATQYWVPAVRPVIVADTGLEAPLSLVPLCVAVACAGVPVSPLFKHQLEPARS